MKFWDFAIVLALLFTTFVTPVEVCFSNASDILNAGVAIYVFNRVVDAVFSGPCPRAQPAGDVRTSMATPQRPHRGRLALRVTQSRT